jgi:sugar phosphate isomerase/epimerase
VANTDLVALYWTTSGPVEIHAGREWSLFDLAERCAHAERVGFKGIGLWHADLQHILETRTLADVKALLDGHGLEFLELEFVWEWFLDPGDERRRAAEPIWELLFEAAAVLDAHHIKVGNIPGTPCELPVLIERFGELCARAADAHEATMVYEFMPPDVNVPDLPTAISVIEAVRAPNAALCVDTWHLAKLGVAVDDLRSLPAGYVGWVEMSDGHYRNLPDPVDETINHRALPGEGEFPIREYVAAVRAAGYDGPWGVEILSQALRERPIEQIFDRAYATSLAQLD